MHSTANLPPLPDYEKIQNLYLFDKPYQFTPILRQICYNLVMKNFQIQNRANLQNRAIGK